MSHNQTINLMSGAIKGMRMVAARPETSPEKREKLEKNAQELSDTLAILSSLPPTQGERNLGSLCEEFISTAFFEESEKDILRSFVRWAVEKKS